MELLAETIYADILKEYEQKKKDLVKGFEKFNVEYGFIESEYNSEKNGYVATAHWTL
jgi:predicted adenine nucleotide alpha hydrolase (AANH) superfamily ATPase